MNVLLKSATIIAPGNTELHNKKRDVHIKNGKFLAFGPTINVGDETKVVELENLHISEGWFDSGVAFGEPGYEERETLDHGLEVASKSGFTELLLNTNTNPAPNTGSHIAYFKGRTEKKITTPYPLGNATKNGTGETLAEMYDMYQSGAKGFYDHKSPFTNANLLKIALQYAQNFDGLVFSYPMDKEIAGKGVVNEGPVSTRLGLKGIPALSEEIQVARDLAILEYTGGKLHIPTISTKGSVKLISNAKKRGLNVSTSVALANLVLTDETINEFDTRYKVLPPLRTQKDVNALKKALLNGTIDFMTTDHTPLDIEEKKIEFDNAAFGTLGMEGAFGLLNKLFGLESAVDILTRGRSRFGIPRPKLEIGAPANVSLFNPSGTSVLTKKDVYSTSKNHAFIGQEILGKVYGAINNGRSNIT